MTLLVSILAAVLPSIILLWYFHRQDRYPEPLGVMMMTFVLGVLAVIPILLVAIPLDLLGQRFDGLQDSPLGLAAFSAFVLAAIPEESFKYLVLTRYSARRSAFDEPMDGLVYGVCASLGFATLENIMYVGFSGDLTVAAMRSVTSVPCHAFLGAIMGYYVGMGKFSSNSRPWLRKAWLIPVVLHGLYDLPLMWVENAYSMTDAKRFSELDAMLVLGSYALVLGILVTMLVLTVRLGNYLVAIQAAKAGEIEEMETSGEATG